MTSPAGSVLPVYLVHWQAPEWCRSAVDSLCKTEGVQLRVTVINNGGDLTLPEEVRILETMMNIGYAGGANRAIVDWLETGEPFAVIGSHDLHVLPDTFSKLMSVAQSSDAVGVVGPRIDGGTAGMRVGQIPGAATRTWVSGTCLLLRRDCVERVGLFDQRLHSYGEDIDYCYRARAAGWTVAMADDAFAKGLGSVDLARANVWIEANWVLVLRKNDGWWAGMRRIGRLLAGFPLLLRHSTRRDGQLRLRALPRALRLLFTPSLSRTPRC